MSYSSETIATTIGKINDEYFLPAIQRPFVWTQEQLIALFDSLMKGYPISSFLFWEVEAANKLKWQIYKFAEHFRFGEIHNDLADPDGRRMTLVLDGQQRLTSLLIGLRGSFTNKTKGKRWDNPEAWRRKRLYIDLLVDPSVTLNDDGVEDGIERTFRFQLSEGPPADGPDSLWIKVGEILNYPNCEAFGDYKSKVLARLPASASWIPEQTAARNLDRLYQMIWVDRIISFFTEAKQDYDRVLAIFVRANDAGTKLSKSDLMLSMISSKWSDISAREEIYNFVETLNTRLDRRNDVNKDFVMKSCLLLSDLDHLYQVKNFTNTNLDIMRANWPRIQLVLRRTFQLVNSFGIDRENLTSLNALLPIAYYIQKTDADLLRSSTSFNVLNAERIRRWLIAALLNHVFGGTSDNTIRVTRTTIDEALKRQPDFPLAQLNASLSRAIKRPSSLTGETLDAALELRYGKKPVFLLLSLLYESKSWGSIAYHVDHIFPKARINRTKLLKSGVPASIIEGLLGAVDRVGNLELLVDHENVEKSAKSFEDWIRTRDSSFLTKHNIPAEEHLWSLLKLPDFVSAREARIRSHLMNLQGDPAGSFSEKQHEGKEAL